MKNRKTRLSQSQNSPAFVLTNFLRQILITGMSVVLIGGVLFLHACEPTGEIKERESMSLIKNNATASVEKRPLDDSVPAGTKTATFALG